MDFRNWAGGTDEVISKQISKDVFEIGGIYLYASHGVDYFPSTWLVLPNLEDVD